MKGAWVGSFGRTLKKKTAAWLSLLIQQDRDKGTRNIASLHKTLTFLPFSSVILLGFSCQPANSGLDIVDNRILLFSCALILIGCKSVSGPIPLAALDCSHSSDINPTVYLYSG